MLRLQMASNPRNSTFRVTVEVGATMKIQALYDLRLHHPMAFSGTACSVLESLSRLYKEPPPLQFPKIWRRLAPFPPVSHSNLTSLID